MIAVYFKLPANSHPLHDSDYMKSVSSDKYGLVIESEDPLFDLSKTDSFIKSLCPVSIELIYYPEREVYSLFQPRFIIFLVMIVLLVST